MNDQEKREFQELKRMVEDLRFQLSRKTGLSSADIRGNVISSSVQAGGLASGAINNSNMFSAGIVDQAAVGADACGQSEWKEEQVNVTVSAGNPSGTATVTSGSVIIGWRATGNQDQFIDNIAVSGTTLTITLAANATADNTFQVTLLKV